MLVSPWMLLVYVKNTSVNVPPLSIEKCISSIDNRLFSINPNKKVRFSVLVGVRGVRVPCSPQGPTVFYNVPLSLISKSNPLASVKGSEI